MKIRKESISSSSSAPVAGASPASLPNSASPQVRWSNSRRFRFEIHNRRALAIEDLQDRTLGTVQHRVTGLAEKLARVEEELRHPLTKSTAANRFETVKE